MRNPIIIVAAGLLGLVAAVPAMAQSYSPLQERQSDLAAIQQDQSQLNRDQQSGNSSALGDDQQRLGQAVEKYQYDTGVLDQEDGGDHHE